MKKYTKILLVLVFCSVLPAVLLAQATRTSYFIESAHNRSGLNPALRPASDYMGVPFLTGIGVDYKTNTFKLDNFTYKKDGERVTFMHSDVTSKQFLSKMSDKNYLTTDVAYDIFSMGFFKDEAFWNFNLGVKAHVDANIPKEFMRLVKEGFAQNQQTTYNVKDLNATGNSYMELGVTYSRPLLNDALVVGVKGKLLGGIANFDLNAKRIDITADEQEWVAKSRVMLNASAPGIKPKYTDKERSNGNTDEMIDGFDFGSWGKFSGYGLGFDIGAVYDFKELFMLPEIFHNMKASMSFTDIGFITWSKSNTTHLESSGEEVLLSPNDYTIHTDGSTSLEDIFDDVIDDLEQAVNLQEKKKSGRSTSLRTTMLIGLEYTILPNELSAGLLFTNRFGNYFSNQELTLSGNYRPKDWLATSLSYSFLHSNFNTFGLAVYLTPSKGVNFFLAGDYIIPHVNPQWVPTTSRAMNVQFGFSIPM